MNLFITKNIYDFLFYKQYSYNIKCLLNYKHELRLINLRQSYIGNERDNINYNCVQCGCDIREWDYFYLCIDCPYINQHHFCLNCIN